MKHPPTLMVNSYLKNRSHGLLAFRSSLLIGLIAFFTLGALSCQQTDFKVDPSIDYCIAFYQSDQSPKARLFKEELDASLKTHNDSYVDKEQTIFLYTIFTNECTVKQAVDFFSPKKVDAIILGYGDDSQLVQVSKDAKEQGIPVFSSNPAIINHSDVHHDDMYTVQTDAMLLAHQMLTPFLDDRTGEISVSDKMLWIKDVNTSHAQESDMVSEFYAQYYHGANLDASLKPAYVASCTKYRESIGAMLNSKEFIQKKFDTFMVLSESVLPTLLDQMKTYRIHATVYAMGRSKITLESVLYGNIQGTVWYSYGGNEMIPYIVHLLEGNSIPQRIYSKTVWIHQDNVYDHYFPKLPY